MHIYLCTVYVTYCWCDEAQKTTCLHSNFWLPNQRLLLIEIDLVFIIVYLQMQTMQKKFILGVVRLLTGIQACVGHWIEQSKTNTFVSCATVLFLLVSSSVAATVNATGEITVLKVSRALITPTHCVSPIISANSWQDLANGPLKDKCI